MAFSEFPFVRYVLFLILGISCYPLFEAIPLSWTILTLSLFYVSYLAMIIKNRQLRRYRFRFGLPLLAYCQLFTVGILACQLKDIGRDSHQLLNHDSSVNYLVGKTLDWDEIKPRSRMNRLELRELYGEQRYAVRGEIVLYHRSDSLQPGQLVLLAGSPSPIAAPTNPSQFDYQTYMRRQGISHTHFPGDRVVVLGNLSNQPIMDFFSAIRKRFLESIERNILHPQSNQIAKALLLGYKKQMDPEIRDAYAATGAMHILAVSGLHVGIIYGFFFLFVKPYRLRTGLRAVYLSCLILIIWGYACMTGLSPSVMRAATMFSFIALAQMQSRSPSIFNPIALSAMVLLCFDPFLLYAVGFQLSYLALLGILLIQPLLLRLWLPPYRWLEYCWQITTVGIAAQMGTFAVSTFYFHQFPTYFIVSNLVAIPGAFLIMALGIPFLLLSSVPLVSTLLALTTDWLIRILNYLIFSIERLPGAVVGNIYLNTLEIALYGFCVAVGIYLWNFPRRKTAWLFVGLLVIFGCHRVAVKLAETGHTHVLWYALEDGNALDFYIDGQLWIWDEANAKELDFKVQPERSRLANGNCFRLQTFERDGKSFVLAPREYGMLEISEKTVLEQQHPMIWREGDWHAANRTETQVVFGALKARLN